MVIFPASKRFAELRANQDSENETPSASALLSVGNLAVCPDGVLAAAFSLLLELASCAPRLYLPYLSDTISSLLFARKIIHCSHQTIIEEDACL